MLLALASVLLAAQPFDIVLNNGRVMDPESGLDGVRHVGIRGKRIAAITASPLRGRVEIDAKGLIVAPGFIDLHSHGQTAENYRFKARDGVTTALEQEVGVSPVGAWYDARAGKALVNFGASAGHLPARMAVMKDSGAFLPVDAAVQRKATAEEREAIKRALRRGLEEGGLGAGFGLAYTPNATNEEMLELFAIAAEAKRPAFVHMRYGSVGDPGVAAALQEVISYAAITGVSVHVVHIGASATRKLDLAMRIVEGARQRGLDITAEAYPYTAGMTDISSAIFKPGFQQDLGLPYENMMWVETGERLTEAKFQQFRKRGGMVVTFTNTEEMIGKAMAHPLIMIASDGMLTNGKGHPRGAGCYARVLGRYVRQEKRLPLMLAIRKMTLMPAQRLEAFAPQMRQKGRLKVGADADIAIFDPATVIDKATYEKPAQYSEGIPHVLVEGTFVVRDSRIVEGVFPGQGIRAR